MVARRLLLAFGLVVAAARVAAAQVVEPVPGFGEDEPFIQGRPISKAGLVARACDEVQFWRSMAQAGSAATLCYPDVPLATWESIVAAGAAVERRASAYFAARPTDELTSLGLMKGPCAPPASASTQAPAATGTPAPAAPDPKALDAALDAVIQMRRQVDQALLAKSPDPGSFEALARQALVKKDAGQACVDFRQQWNKLSGAPPDEVVKQKREAALAPWRARASDVLRKASPLSGSLLTGSGLAELPGAPDKVIFSLMTALGADSQTSGSNAVMTLNLASLFVPDQAARLKLGPLVRNVFLRATLPLSSTNQGSAIVAATATDEPRVSRFSIVLGGSLLDDADPRLFGRCYQVALAYAPFRGIDDPVKAAADVDRRRDYYDVCNRLIANQQRVAWRAGVRYQTTIEATPKTRAEVYAGALVWAPDSHLNINVLYQRVKLPDAYHLYGGGISVAGNVGGAASGVDSWARIGIDLLVLGKHTDDPKSDDWEARITPTVRARVLDNSIVTLSLGPRFFGGHIDDPDLVAQVALVQDVDTLFDPLLR